MAHQRPQAGCPRKLEIIDARAREKPDADRLKELDRKLQSETAELDRIERKLKVLSDSLEHLQAVPQIDEKPE